MARAATTTDVFNAIAEDRRRQILRVLRSGEHTVGDLVDELDLEQPQVSKHLRVLREVDVVSVREDGRHRLYRLNGRALKPVHDWISEYRQFWDERFDLIDDVLIDLEQEGQQS
jgi:DNA-binding transcriptional ArsR family regulator